MLSTVTNWRRTARGRLVPVPTGAVPRRGCRSERGPSRSAHRPLPCAAWLPAALMALLAVAGCSAPHVEDARRQAEDAVRQDEPGQQPDAPPGGDQPDEPAALAIADASAPASAGVLGFPVTLSGAVSAPVTVAYETEDDTALAGTHYTAASGTLTLGDGARSASVEVAILDGEIEQGASKSFLVMLSNPTGAALSKPAATGTITGGGESTATGPSGPTGPTSPTGPGDPTSPTGPTSPGGPSGPTDPVDPVDPCKPGARGARGDPGDPGDPGRHPDTSDSGALALSSLAITCGGSMYPPFAADTLHYALTCHGSPTLNVTARTGRAGAKLTLRRKDSSRNTVSTTGVLNARVPVGGNHDVAIEVSDGSESRTYVAHCLPAAFPTIDILTRTGQVKDGLLLLTPAYGAYRTRTTFMAVVDNNGVPRFHRLLTDTSFWAMDFRHHGSGVFSLARRDAYNLNDSPFGNWEIELLNKRLEVTATVTTASPLSQTDGHEFLIAANGDYVMLSYYDDEPRDFSDHGGSMTETVADSVIQRRGAGSAGKSSFTWNSWDHRSALQWGNDCKVGMFLPGTFVGPPGYAHINGVQLLSDGDYVASSRGCAQVLRIDGTTGSVEWKLGGTAPPAGSATEHLELVEHSNRAVVEEFCGQHHVTLTSKDTVVMYDNGEQCLGARKDTTPFSRAVEYDISSGTQAEFEREYRLPAAQGYFPYRGGVHVLDGFGGSVHWLISWGGDAKHGTVALSKTIAVSEVDPATGTVHLEVNMRTGTDDAWTYRAYRIAASDVDIPLNLP